MPRSYPYYLVSTDGDFRFTPYGAEKFRERFESIGIRPESIRTYPEYIRAQKLASQHFNSWLYKVVDNLPNDGEWAAIKRVLLESGDLSDY